MSIDSVPDLRKYPHICNAQKSGRLVVFVGAGLPALWGCSRWKEMACSLIESCYKNNYIDYWTRDTLLRKYSATPRKLITIAKSIFEDKVSEDKYISALRKTLKKASAKKKKYSNLMNNLFSLNASFVTTNIDSHFSKVFDPTNVHYKLGDYSRNTKNITHLHGVIKDKGSLVMTVDEYLSKYNDSGFKDFLEGVFSDEENCILFIGYGIDEMEIIDFLIQKYSSKNEFLSKFVNRFYVLLPFFQQEEHLYEYEKMYFDQINMTVIPYSINENGYAQLDGILAEWRKYFEDEDGDMFYKYNRIMDDHL